MPIGDILAGLNDFASNVNSFAGNVAGIANTISNIGSSSGGGSSSFVPQTLTSGPGSTFTFPFPFPGPIPLPGDSGSSDPIGTPIEISSSGTDGTKYGILVAAGVTLWVLKGR